MSSGGFFIADILRGSAAFKHERNEKCPDNGRKIWSDKPKPMNWSLPAWVFCTRYSDRPSSGPRMRKLRSLTNASASRKRHRASFTVSQIKRLSAEFDKDRYLNESRRRHLARELNLMESQVKIWFQNKRAKTKKASGVGNSLALYLMAEGLYNHSVLVEKPTQKTGRPSEESDYWH